MYILMISRGIPTPHHPQWGCFEKDQAEALARLGHKVIVMSIDARFKRHRGSLGLHHSSINGVEYYNQVVLPGELFSRILGRERYWTTIKRNYYIRLAEKIIALHGRPDVIYSQFFTNTAFGVDIKKSFGVPLVAIEHYSKFNDFTLTQLEKKCAAYAFQGADKIIAVADTLARNINKLFNKDCSVVHNMFGVEFEGKFNISSRDKDKPLVFVSTASLIYRKGFDVLINAFAEAGLPKDKWCMKIIGWGEEYNNLKRQISEHHLQNNILLLGKMTKSQIVAELSSSHAFILPSRSENFSVAVLEALALGLPVLATECGGIKECIDDSNGVIVPVDNVPALAEGIKQIYAGYDNFDRVAIARDSHQRFSPLSIARQITNILESVTNQ